LAAVRSWRALLSLLLMEPLQDGDLNRCRATFITMGVLYFLFMLLGPMPFAYRRAAGNLGGGLRRRSHTNWSRRQTSTSTPPGAAAILGCCGAVLCMTSPPESAC